MSEKQTKEYADIIRCNVLAMLRMVNHMMAEDRAYGTETVGTIDVKIDELLVGVAKAVSPFAADRHIELLYDVDAPLYARCDPEMLERVLYNLLSNAIKFTDAQGHVYLSAHEKEAFVRINVADTGAGLPDDAMRALDAPHEAAAHGKRGLRIAKTLTAAMNGRLTVLSEKGIGTTFSLHLVRAHEASAAVAENSSAALEELTILFSPS